jgi:hypothetical protein
MFNIRLGCARQLSCYGTAAYPAWLLPPRSRWRAGASGQPGRVEGLLAAIG